MMEKAKTAKTPHELLTIAKENGIELSETQANEYYAKLNKSGELTDNELDNVAGGGCGSEDEDRSKDEDQSQNDIFKNMNML